MGTEWTLSKALELIGFVKDIGNETFDNKPVLINQGAPRSFGRNQGTLVVYDENGTPWFQRTCNLEIDFEFKQRFGLRPGCYVPHSNDGGYGIKRLCGPRRNGGGAVLAASKLLAFEDAIIKNEERIQGLRNSIDILERGVWERAERFGYSSIEGELNKLEDLKKQLQGDDLGPDESLPGL